MITVKVYWAHRSNSDLIKADERTWELAELPSKGSLIYNGGDYYEVCFSMLIANPDEDFQGFLLVTTPQNPEQEIVNICPEFKNKFNSLFLDED